MKLDVFHSLGRIDAVNPHRSDAQAYRDFFEQASLAEDIGFETLWVAESHFSSEVQKAHAKPVIPNYHGEVGLNNDSMLLAQALFERTSRIGFGTAIMNIVGGNGGPIAAADRVRALAWHNHLRPNPRRIHIGVASGRFPYINRPFGIVPRDRREELLWPQVNRLIFLESLEIFLRLARGETLASDQVTQHFISRDHFDSDTDWESVVKQLAAEHIHPESNGGFAYRPRYEFEALKLVPELDQDFCAQYLHFVLGSHDPMARELGLQFADLDIFNLSFTPPDKLNLIHEEMFAKYSEAGRVWHRSRLPRTVLVFIDEDADKARVMAEDCFDTYIEAMRGTVKMPPREALMARALIGEPAQMIEQLSPDSGHGFHPDDRLMLWFEFNQSCGEAIAAQMRLFADKVMPVVKG